MGLGMVKVPMDTVANAGMPNRRKNGSAHAQETTAVGKLLLFFFFIAHFAPMGMNAYRIIPYLDEISLVCLTILNLSMLLSKNTPWNVKVKLLKIVAAVTAFSVTYATVFTLEYGGDVFSAAASQRWFFWWTLLPIGIGLTAHGCDSRQIIRTSLAAFSVAALVYFYRQNTWDLGLLANNSENGYEGTVIRHDEVRGYRLRYPQYVFYYLLFILPCLVFFRKNKLIYFFLFGSLLYFYLDVYSRLHIIFWMAVLILTLTLMAFNSKLLKLAALLILFAVTILGTLPLAADFLAAASNDRLSGAVRFETANILYSILNERPLLGLGVGSSRGVSLQEVFGRNFFPNDVGYLGVAGTYGLVGLVIGAAIHIKVLSITGRAMQTATGSFDRAFAVAAFQMACFLTVGGITFFSYVAPSSILIGAIISLHAHLLSKETKYVVKSS